MSAILPHRHDQPHYGTPQLEMSPLLRDQLITEVGKLARAAARQGQQPGRGLRPDSAVELAGFLASHDDYFGTASNQETIDALADRALDLVAQGRMGSHWIGGLTGISWQLARLARRSGDWTSDFSQELDEALLEMLQVEQWRGDYDLIIGLTGYGIYALEHPCPEWRQRLLKPVLRHLAQLARRDADGLSWHTHPGLLPEHQRRQFPSGYHNLGLAHGIAGVIGLLARAVAEAIEADSAAAMLGPAMSWLLARQQAVEVAGFHFPNQKEAPGSSRPLAWCYGDFGIVCALFRAASATGRSDWHDVALAVARDCARLRGDQAAIRDPGLCHGSAGAGLIFLRLWQHCGDPLLAQASHHWLEQSLSMRVPELAASGGVFSIEGTWNDPRLEPSLGLLTGLAGVGMTYLAALGYQDPNWDASLLTNLTSAPGA